MSMTYKDIQNAVISKCCDESQRGDVKNAIQFRHAWLWDADDWTFKKKVSTVTFTSGTQQIAGPSDLSAAVALYDANGDVIRGIADPREFFDYANSNTNLTTGTANYYTVVNGQIFIDTKGDGTSGVIIYEKLKPTLSNDSDTTGLPDGYDLALVHGGKAEMFKLQIVPDLATSFDQDFTAAVNALGKNYLSQMVERGQAWGAYRPGFRR